MRECECEGGAETCGAAMGSLQDGTPQQRALLYRRASVLALITIVYNIAEGLISVFFGIEDETVALFGFGVDSFVEVLSGVGVWHMTNRLRKDGTGSPDRFERRALRITGAAFYILAAGLLVTAAVNIYRGHAPETTVWGIVVASVSILSMWALLHWKVKVGRRLNSSALLADANCTRACMYLSVALLLSSAGYELTSVGGLDSAGALFIAWFAYREGREAMEKAENNGLCSCSGGRG